MRLLMTDREPLQGGDSGGLYGGFMGTIFNGFV